LIKEARETGGVTLIRLVPVESGALTAVGYDAASRTLRLRFESGGLYDYFDVPPEVYAGLRHDDHPWTAWGDHITSSYEYERLQ
jgi:hypothetical protein